MAPLAVTRSFFGRFRFGAFADTEAGELRRTEVAKHINSLYKLCKQEGGEALETVLYFYSSSALAHYHISFWTFLRHENYSLLLQQETMRK